MIIEAVVDRIRRLGVGSDMRLRLTALGSLAVAQVEQPNTDVARAGRRFGGGNQIIANGIAPVTAIPTTTATLALYNAEQAGGRCLVIDQLGFWLGSGTSTAGATLLATVSPGIIASPPAAMATGYGIGSLSGIGISKARWTTAVTLPSSPIAPAWFQVLSQFQLAAANVGQGDCPSMLSGGIVIPPQYCLGLAILSGTGTTPLYGVSAIWNELELDLE